MEAHKQKLKALEKMGADYLNDADKKRRERIGLENERIAILTNPQTGAKVELQRVLAALDANAKELRDIDAAVTATSEEKKETQNRITKLENDKAQQDAERENETIQEKINALWAADLKRRAERLDLPDVDVAAVGGWSDLTCLKTAYQQPDIATMYRVVSEPTELREAR